MEELKIRSQTVHCPMCNTLMDQLCEKGRRTYGCEECGAMIDLFFNFNYDELHNNNDHIAMICIDRITND